MPIDPKLLEILCCPTTHIALRELDADTLQQLNDRIAEGTLLYADGAVVEAVLTEGLITEDNKMLYRIDGDIPIMLPEKAIPLQSD